MPPDDARKINDLYGQLDKLQAENAVLKEQLTQVNTEVISRLDELKTLSHSHDKDCCKE